MPVPHVRVEPDFRAEVARFRAGERRRVFPATLHLGVPEGPRPSLQTPWPVPAEYDAGLRFDLAVALVDTLLPQWPVGEDPWAWLTRPGVPEVHDCDLGWLSAVWRALAAHGLALRGFRAVTRPGWLDPVTGESRTWKRLRT